MMLNDIIRARMIGKLMEIKKTNPTLTSDEAARAVGYSSHAMIFKLLGQEEYDKLFAKYVKKGENKKQNNEKTEG